ncbi:MAG: hypothetical protein HC918_08385 [Oscillatoriales cyanobacterium SM2_1_8]|nr:hypothetical protein [Oscillatoriales cyanobacterium SM2_1_8]
MAIAHRCHLDMDGCRCIVQMEVASQQGEVARSRLDRQHATVGTHQGCCPQRDQSNVGPHIPKSIAGTQVVLQPLPNLRFIGISVEGKPRSQLPNATVDLLADKVLTGILQEQPVVPRSQHLRKGGAPLHPAFDRPGERNRWRQKQFHVYASEDGGPKNGAIAQECQPLGIHLTEKVVNL